MSDYAVPSLGGGAGGPATVTFPLVAPPGAAGAESYAFTTGGGLHGDGSGAVVLSTGGADALVVASGGGVSIANTLAASGLATLAGGVATQALSASRATVSGDASVGGGLGVAGSAQITGDLSARNITGSGALSIGSVTSQGPLSAASLQVPGAATLGSLRVQGTFEAAAIASDGPLYIPSSAPNAPGLGLADQHGTGVFGAPGSLGLAVAGANVLSLGADASATFAGALSAPSGAFTSLSTGTLAASGATQLQAVSAQSLALAGAATLGGDLTVQGTARLANLTIDELATDHDLSVGGNTTLQQNLAVAGGATLSGTLSVAGQTSLAGLSAGAVQLATALQVLTDTSYAPVYTTPAAGGGTNAYSFHLAPSGNLGLSGALTVLQAATIGGTLASGAITAPSAQLSGALGVGGALTVGGAASAASLSIGGAYLGAYAGNPNGNVNAGPGALVIDTADGLLYIKVGGGSSNTGWAAVATSATALHYPLLLPTSSDATTPQAAFADDPQTGLGRTSAIPLFLGVAGAAALAFDAGGRATFAAGATFASALTVQGATTLAGLSAGTTTLGATTAGSFQATSGTFSGTLNSASLITQGAQVATLTASGAMSAASGTFSGAVTAGSLAAPRVLFAGATLSSGSGAPAGAVGGAPGDVYTEQDTGAAWLKTSGAGTTSGWVQVSTSATGTTFPLAAPNGSAAAPSYGFAQGALGITAGGTNLLWAITNGQVGWSLAADLTFAMRGAASVAGTFSVAQATTLAALTATSGAFSANLSAQGTLNVAGATTLASLGAGAISATSLAATGGVSSGAAVAASTTVSAGSALVVGANQWTSASSAPSGSGGTQGDVVSVRAGSAPLYVRASGGYVAVALAGASAPSQYPLTAPDDSAASPSYTWANSNSSGMFKPGTNQLGFSTAGVQAAIVDANQNWTFAAAVAGAAATFTQATINGPLSASGAATLGSTLQVTGAVTLSSSLSASSASLSGALSAASATLGGALSTATITTSSDVSVGGNLTVQGATTYTGVQKAPYLQVGDGTVTAPSIAWQSETGLGFWRKAAGTLAVAQGGVNILTLTASAATFAGAGAFASTVQAPVVDAPVVRNSGGTLSLQAGTTTVLSLGASGVAAAQPVTAPSFSLSTGGTLSSANDTRPAFPVSVSLTDPRGFGISSTSVPDYNSNTTYTIFATGVGGITSGSQAPNGYAQGSPGYIYAFSGGGSGTSAYIYEGTSSGKSSWAAIRTTSQAVIPNFPVVGPAGSAAAATFAVGAAGTGLYAGTDAISRAFVGLAQGGAAVARFATFTNNSTAVYILGLGDPTSSSVAGGLLASSQAPSTGAPSALPAMLYQDTRGGAAQSLWVNEATGTTPAWAKVLTSSSSVSASFPLLAPSDSATAPSYSWAGNTQTGFYLAGNNSLGFTTNGARAGTVSSAQAWTFYGAVAATTTLSVNGAATLSSTLSVTGAASLASTLTVAGATTLQAGLSGTTATLSGTLGVTGLATFSGGSTGTTASWSTSSTSPLFALTETTAPSTASAGQLFVKSSDHNLYFLSSSGVTTQITPSTTAYPLAAPADSVTAPDYSWSGNTGTGMYLAGTNSIGFTTNGTKAATVSSSQAWVFAGAVSAAATLSVTGATTLQASLTGTSASFSGNVSVGGTLAVTGGSTLTGALTVGALTTTNGGVLSVAGSVAAPSVAIGSASTGVYSGTTQYFGAFIGFAQGGLPTGHFGQGTATGGSTVWRMGLGDPTSTSTLGGLTAGTVSPTGTIGGLPGQLYQYLGGGAGQSLWVNESTTTSTSWAKVLTTSSTITPTFPMQSTTLGSASSPAYGFSASGYTTTGMLAAPDAGSNNIPTLAFTVGGVITGYYENSTANSLPIYTLCLGPPNITSAPYNGCIRSSQQAASGNIIAAPGQLAINPSGGAGTILAVKESGVGTSSGWSFLYTQGTAQIAGQNGSAAAPYLSFAGAKNAGMFFDGNYPCLSQNGVTTLSWSTAAAGIAGYNCLVFGVNNTPGVPYIVGVPSTAANAGNPITNQVGAYQGALLINGAGAAGNQLWIHESSSATAYSSWARVLSETTALSFSRLLQTTAPNTVSGQALVWADANNLLHVSIYGVNASSAPTLKQEIVATPYGASQTITQANNNTTICLTTGTQFTLTLPASSTTVDLCYRFQVENAAGVVIKANTSQIIYYGGSASSSGGTLTTTTLGATIELFCRAGTNNWFSRGPTGSWTAA